MKRNTLSKVAVSGVTTIAALILMLLTALNVVSVSYIDVYEKTFFVDDNILGGIIALAAIIAIGLILRNDRVQSFLAEFESDDHLYIKARRYLCWLVVFVSMLWVMASQLQQINDPLTIEEAVDNLRLGDISMFLPGGYLNRLQHQLGYVWVCYVISMIFGSYNNVFFQILNCCCLALTYRELALISDMSGIRRRNQLMALGMGVVFYPYILYCSFVYANIPALFLSILAARLALELVNSFDWKKLVLFGLSIGTAVFIKSNCLIFLIALVIFVLFKSVSERKLKQLVLIAVLVGALVLQMNVPIIVAKTVSRQAMDQGNSSWSWIAMGLQEGPRAPGWYNDFVWDTYSESGRNTEEQKELSIKSIEESITHFSTDPAYALSFFARKTASEWTSPNFQSINTVRHMQYNTLRFEPAEWVWWITTVNFERASDNVMNIFELITFFGALCYVVFADKNKDFENSMLLLIVFIGGFLFHFVWEAKSQYTITYFVLLFPFVGEGLELLSSKLTNLFTASKGGNGANAVAKTLLGLLVLVIGVSVPAVALSPSVIVDNDRYDYEAYYESMDARVPVQDGSYVMMTDTLNLYLGFMETPAGMELSLHDVPTYNTVVELDSSKGISRLKMDNNSLYITCTDCEDDDYVPLMLIKSRIDARNSWDIEKSEDGCVFVVINSKYALTYNELNRDVFVTEYNGGDNQKWRFLKATD